MALDGTIFAVEDTLTSHFLEESRNSVSEGELFSDANLIFNEEIMFSNEIEASSTIAQPSCSSTPHKVMTELQPVINREKLQFQVDERQSISDQTNQNLVMENVAISPSTPSNDEVSQAIETAADIERLFCEQCSKTFKSRSGLHEHKQRMHQSGKKYTCKTCDMGFISKAHYVRHINKHMDHKPYKCPNDGCDKDYFYPSNWKQHTKLCSGLTKKTCHQCQKVLSSASALKDHIEGAHKKKDIKCNCGKTFHWRGSFYNHKKKCSLA